LKKISEISEKPLDNSEISDILYSTAQINLSSGEARKHRFSMLNQSRNQAAGQVAQNSPQGRRNRK